MDEFCEKYIGLNAYTGLLIDLEYSEIEVVFRNLRGRE